MTLMFLSLWVVIALFGINDRIADILPGYKTGHLLTWELGALVVSLLLARLIYVRWGGVIFRRRKGKTDIVLNQKYFMLLLVHSMLFLLIALWHFLEF